MQNLFASLLTFVLLFISTAIHAQSQTLNYTYDELGRLTLVKDSKNDNRSYAYDPAGNRISVGVGQVATPTISPAGGTFTGAVTVTLATTTSGATLYYILGNSVFLKPYTTPITLNTNTTLKVKAVKEGVGESAQVTATFVVPTIRVPGSRYSIPGPYSNTYSVSWSAVTGATHYLLHLVNATSDLTVTSTSGIQSGQPDWVKACMGTICSEKGYF